MAMKVWLDGAVVDAADARISALDRGVIWGCGLFETLRAYGGQLWAFEEHYARLRDGADVLDISAPTAVAVREAMELVLRANGLEDAGVRITVTGGAGPPEPHVDATGPPSVLATAWPLPDYTELYEHGSALITVPGGGRPLAGVKTTSYAASIAGRVAARRAGADDALFVCDDDRVLEATGANLMIVHSGRLATPPVDEGVLPGVTRRIVLQVGRDLGFEPVVEPLYLRDLFAADEVLLTSSLREVYPVRSIDGRALNTGEVARRTREAYRAAVLALLKPDKPVV